MSAAELLEPPTRVLVVEDDPLIGADLVACLNHLGYDAPRPAEDVAAALISVEREHPQVAILDIMLGCQGDGIELASILRGRSSEIAIIFLTGRSDKGTIDRAVQVRPCGYLIKPFSRDMVYAAVEMAAQGLNRSSVTATAVPHGTRLRHVLRFIEENLARNLTLPELASEAKLSRDHFGRLFRQHVGMAPHQYLTQRRMVLARRLLETTDTAICQIALMVGYESQAYFTTVFRKEGGQTPAAYRRTRRSVEDAPPG